MKLVGTTLLGLALAFVLLASVDAQEKGKEVTLEGKITCAKCDLGTATKCETVIVVKKDGKDVTFYFDKAGHKKNHGPICQTPMEGSVTGVVSKEGDKNMITVKEVKFKK
jgi:hypothetical protein